MSSVNHETIPVRVWVDIDIGIAAEVRWLNKLLGVRTFTSCQGTIGEGGPEPYHPYIVAWWPKKHDKKIRERYHVGHRPDSPSGWYSLSPRETPATRTLSFTGLGPIPKLSLNAPAP